MSYKIEKPKGAPDELNELRNALEYNSASGIFTWKINANNNNALRGKIAGSDHKKGYLTICCNGKRYLAHRLAWFMYYGEWPKNQIDHINGNRKDNRIINLRDATHFQNHLNTSLARSGKLVGTSYRGNGRWEASCGKVYLGRFDSEYKAHRAYLEHVAKERGDIVDGFVESWKPMEGEWVAAWDDYDKAFNITQYQDISASGTAYLTNSGWHDHIARITDGLDLRCTPEELKEKTEWK